MKPAGASAFVTSSLASVPRGVRTLVLRLIQVLFVVAVVTCFLAAVAPPSVAPSFMPWDKAQHFTAFFILTGLGVAALPRVNPIPIGIALSVFRALIEVVQAIPAVHRDGDVYDWLADSVGIIAVLAAVLLPTWRTWLGGAAPLSLGVRTAEAPIAGSPERRAPIHKKARNA
jgi:hypothetical protein